MVVVRLPVVSRQEHVIGTLSFMAPSLSGRVVFLPVVVVLAELVVVESGSHRLLDDLRKRDLLLELVVFLAGDDWHG